MKRWLCLLLLWTQPAAATTVDELMKDDKLRLSSRLEPAEGIVVGQEVRMLIEVSTPRWFAGGTRIALPEVDNLVVLRRDEFATNLSRREQGVTWVVQQWQLELYPQRAGRYFVPAVTLELAVNDAEAGIVRGRLQTEPLTLEALIPEALRGLDAWLATPSLVIEEAFDRELVGLSPGDAFTRTLEVRGSRVTAMMLPELEAGGTAGLAAYPDIPTLENRSNRGEATAIRRQAITYVVEAPGQYVLPEQQIAWWNTDAGRLETAVLPEVSVDAGSAVTSSIESITLPTLSVRHLWLALVLLAGGLLLIQWRKMRARPLARARAALRRGDARTAAAALYRWLNTRGEGWLTLRGSAAAVGEADAAEALLQAGFGREGEPPAGGGKLVDKLKRGRPREASTKPLSLNPTQPRK